MARSNSTLSGCLELTSASGLVAFLLVVQATVSTNPASSATTVIRRDMEPRELRTSDSLQCSFGGCLEQFSGVASWIACTEHGVARHQNFRSRAHYLCHRIQGNAAIDFNPIMQTAVRPQVRQSADLMYHRRNELLPAKTGIHRHDQHEVDDIQHFGQGFNRSRGIDDHSRLGSMAANQMQGPIEMPARLLMD